MRQSPTDAPYGATAFLARHPEEEDHDVVFFSNPTLAHNDLRWALMCSGCSRVCPTFRTHIVRVFDSGAVNGITAWRYELGDPLAVRWEAIEVAPAPSSRNARKLPRPSRRANRDAHRLIPALALARANIFSNPYGAWCAASPCAYP